MRRSIRSALVARRTRVRAPAFLAYRRPARSITAGSGEWKSADVSPTLAANTTGAVYLLNGMLRGDDINARGGRQVLMRSLEIRAQMYGTAGAGVDQVHRLLIVYDKQTNGVAMAPTDITELAAADVKLPLTPYKLENRHRFIVLYDSGPIAINAVAEPASHRVVTAKKAIKLGVTFNAGNAGTVADIITGSVYAVALGSVAAGGTAGSIALASRIRYEDK